jgi:hypothetical protein
MGSNFLICGFYGHSRFWQHQGHSERCFRLSWRKIDGLIMRACDATLSLPIVLIALLLAVILGPSLANLIYVMGLVLWARYARVIRGETLSWKEQEFIGYARLPVHPLSE